jgi:uncharacterized protein
MASACHDDAVSFVATAPPLRPPVLFDQAWADLTFVHWPVEPQRIAHMYPPGTSPDVFDDGLTYVGLVPFTARRTRLGTSLVLPYFGSFAETNIRLYSVDKAGRHGILFPSLETERLAVVALTRTVLGVPYTWAKMRVTVAGEVVDYRSVRRWPRRGLHSRLTVRVGGVIEPTALEVWLSARWGAHTRKAGRTWWIPIEHAQWPLHAAEILELNDDLVAASGVPTAGERLRPMFSPGVRSRFGRPVLVR